MGAAVFFCQVRLSPVGHEAFKVRICELPMADGKALSCASIGASVMRMEGWAVTQVCMLLRDVNCGPPVSFWPDISWQGRGSAGKL